jgi:glycosyltransferase involved in cell wall biosynthesis
VVSFVLNNVLEKMALRMADRVICASDSIATEAALTGLKTSKLSIMYPLVQLGVREQAARTPPSPRPSNPSPYLLSVGQQTGRKRFDLLIRALRSIPEPYRLVLVGDGPFQQQYRTLAEELGVGSRVHFLTNVDDSTLHSLYRLCALYVLVSENEGFPITVAEAMIEGAPVVLAGPSTYALRRRLPPVFLTTVYELDASVIAKSVTRRLLEVESEGPQLHSRIRAWAIQLFPTEEQIVKEYSRIFESLSSRFGPISGASRPWVSPDQLGAAGTAQPHWVSR